MGKNRATLANFMRLLKLPAEVQIALKERKLSQGHARALLPIEQPEQQVKLYHIIAEQDLSVRRVEQLVRDYVEGRIFDFDEASAKGAVQKAKAASRPASLFADMENHLQKMFNTKVRMTMSDKGQGKITIPFKNDEELQNILATLDRVGETI